MVEPGSGCNKDGVRHTKDICATKKEAFVAQVYHLFILYPLLYNLFFSTHCATNECIIAQCIFLNFFLFLFLFVCIVNFYFIINQKLRPN